MSLIHPFTHTFTHQRRLAAMQGTNQLIRSNWGLGVSLRDTSTLRLPDDSSYLLSHIAPPMPCTCIQPITVWSIDCIGLCVTRPFHLISREGVLVVANEWNAGQKYEQGGLCTFLIICFLRCLWSSISLFKAFPPNDVQLKKLQSKPFQLLLSAHYHFSAFPAPVKRDTLSGYYVTILAIKTMEQSGNKS